VILRKGAVRLPEISKTTKKGERETFSAGNRGRHNVKKRGETVERGGLGSKKAVERGIGIQEGCVRKKKTRNARQKGRGEGLQTRKERWGRRLSFRGGLNVSPIQKGPALNKYLLGKKDPRKRVCTKKQRWIGLPKKKSTRKKKPAAQKKGSV